MTASQLFTVGVITKTHGLSGEVKVFPRTDFPEIRFKKGAGLLMQSPAGGPTIRVHVSSARLQQNLYLVKFEEFNSIEEVEKYKNWELKVTEQDLVPLSEHEYYIHQLVGCKVITDEGQALGELVQVLQPGANDVYVVQNSQKREILLPVIQECILDIDIEKQTIIVHVLPGLLD